MTEPAGTILPLDRDKAVSEPNIPASFQEMCLTISAESDALCIGKQRDYGPGNITAFGEVGVLVRLNDKIERLKHLIGNGLVPTNESLEDTWLDIVNYGRSGGQCSGVHQPRCTARPIFP